ncbi:MAG: TetR/AcrR family transcriptional regulator [Pseudomonadota bacterium]
MARPKASPEQRAEVRRSIQQAAVELYRAEGLGGVSARAVATKAGVSVGTIYSYFGDLKGLGQSLWEPQIARLEDELRAVAAQHDKPLDRIEALLRAYLDFGIDQAELYRNALMFVRPSTLKTPEKQSLSGFAFPALLKSALEQGQADGSIANGDPVVLAQVLWSGVHGALALPVNMDRVALQPTEKLASVMVQRLMRSVRVG